MANTFSYSTARRGFTLIESTIALVVVSVMMVAAMSVAGQSARSRTVQQEQVRGEALARQLLSEIMQEPYQQSGVTTTVLGPEAGETRSTYNDVDDFNGLSESPPKFASGTAIPGFTGWTRAAKVEWVSVTGLLSSTFTVSSTETGMKRITVTVTAPSGKVTALVGLRSKYSPFEHVPSVATTYTSYMGVTVQIGSDSTTASSASAELVNQVP
ncbi:MAG: methylation site containing protein [Phycisphaerales bacterium]|jgi:MSHA pilin protein MshD|nr:methylation site containing protein [Phycisphaerales bacterium]MDB5299740.1 methylation site containing protein [Phycisphaerales bacterium]MDB5303205.1 methylation site containing protein [Phycisphaerales bacterium]